MAETPIPTSLVVVPDVGGDSALQAVEHALATPGASFAAPAALTNVILQDPYLAARLAELHAGWQIRPPRARSLLGRLRTRLAWWLLQPEIEQANAAHASLVRVVDSLVVVIDEERAARRRVEEQLAFQRDGR